jgi:hypothetical protein
MQSQRLFYDRKKTGQESIMTAVELEVIYHDPESSRSLPNVKIVREKFFLSVSTKKTHRSPVPLNLVL